MRRIRRTGDAGIHGSLGNRSGYQRFQTLIKRLGHNVIRAEFQVIQTIGIQNGLRHRQMRGVA